MAVNYTRQEANTVGAINAEFEKIKTALQDALSRKGGSPNSMESNLDMNSNRILNLLDAVNNQEPATWGQVKDYIEDLVASGELSQDAVDIMYDNLQSELNATNVQAAIDELDSIIDQLKDPRLRGFEISDAITSWWAQPPFVNNGRYSYFSSSSGLGALQLTVLDNQDQTQYTYKVDTENFSPDDHNTGSVVAGEGKVFAVWPGRTVDTAYGSEFSCYYVYFDEGEDISRKELTEIDMGRDYPVVFDIGDEFLFTARITNNANEIQYTSRLQGWPFNGFGQKQDFLQSTKSWPYIGTRRSAKDKNKINMTVGFHPTNEPSSNVYFGTIERTNGTGDWLIKNDGTTVANISTGSGLPFADTDLELAYNASVGEKVRLLTTGDDCFVIVSYTASDGSDSIYKYVRKVNGTWNVTNLVAAGLPFEEEAGVQYFGGAHLSSDENTLYLTREDNGLWYYEEYYTTDNGATFTKAREFRTRFPDGASVVAGRPVVEDYSYENWKPISEREERVVTFLGRYNPISYNDFNTSLVTDDYLFNNWRPNVGQSNGAVVSSEGCLATAHRSAVVASRSSFANGRISGSFACSTTDTEGVECAGIASAGNTVDGEQNLVAASNNITFTVNSKNTAAISSVLSDISGEQSSVVASEHATLSGDRSALIGSSYSFVAFNRDVGFGRAVSTSGPDRVFGGYDTDVNAATDNRKWELENRTGNLYLSGTVNSSHTFADTAKMIKNGEGSEIESGYLVSLFGDKVYKAKQGEHVVGVIAATPSRIDNNTPFSWQGRFLTDDFGKYIYENIEMVRTKDYDGPVDKYNQAIKSDDKLYTVRTPKPNPAYNKQKQNVPRSERPDEWACVGVEGLLRVRTDSSVTKSAVEQANLNRVIRYLIPSSTDGVGKLSTEPRNLQIMSVEKEFDSDKGYGVTLCLLK